MRPASASRGQASHLPAARRLLFQLTRPRSQEAVDLHVQARKASIAQREARRLADAKKAEHKRRVRASLTSSKYPKSFVVTLKRIFDEYDIDGSGSISKGELRQALLKRKQASERQRFDRPKSRRERLDEAATRAGQHVADFHEAMFEAIDTDTDGEVDFGELLCAIFPLASQRELATMVSWVEPDECSSTEEEEDSLDEEDRQEIRAIFTLYDMDKSDDLSLSELQEAFSSFMSGDEVEALFREADRDGNQRIDLEEFTELIVSTGIYR